MDRTDIQITTALSSLREHTRPHGGKVWWRGRRRSRWQMPARMVAVSTALVMRWLQVMLERGAACVKVFVGVKSAVSLSTALSPRGAACALSMKRAPL